MRIYHRYLTTLISAVCILLLLQFGNLMAQDPYSIIIDPGHPSENSGSFGACGINEPEIVLEYGLDLWFLFFDDSQEPDDWSPF